MCEIKRINKLKSMSVEMTTRIREAAPLSTFIPEYVSKSGLTYTDLAEKIDKIAGCASILELKSSFVENNGTFEQRMAVSAANYCKQHTVCPVCADRSQARRRARFNDPIKRQAAEVKDGKKFAYIVTYTVADGESLSERLEHLKESKKAFRLMGQRRNKSRSNGEAAKFRAAISTIELKRGEDSGLWHTHCHDLVFTDRKLDYQVYDYDKRKLLQEKYGKDIPKEELSKVALRLVSFRGETIPASKLSLEWMQATGGDSVGIDVSPVRHIPKNCSDKKRRMYKKMSFEESIAYQAKEVLKYCTKPMDTTPKDAIEIIDETYNKRMVATYGEFRGVAGDDYTDAAGSDDDTFVLVWNKQQRVYGEPQPGKLRDFVGDESEHDTRVQCGRITGEYRRRRRSLVESRALYADDLHRALDDSKRSYRAQINSLWHLHHHRKSAEISIKNANCDKYSATIALAGCYIPGSDYKEAFHQTFD
jgi:hypothetical protein